MQTFWFFLQKSCKTLSTMDLLSKLLPLKARHEELSALMSQGGLGGDAFVKLSREYAELEPIVVAVNAYQKSLKDFEDVQAMLNDPEMADMAQEEYKALKETIPALEQQLKVALLPKDIADNRNAILEIRAGTGGEEAALFGGDLFSMYRGYAAVQGWKFEVLEMREAEMGGYKEIVAEVTGNGVFAKLKYESGVHRVQRVPETEASGRVHTSAATVAVLPEAEEVDIDLNMNDVKIDTFRSQGAGGQSVNTTDSAVRLTHIPTGVVVEMQDERSQHKNRERAMKILRSRLFEAERLRLLNERSADRKSQVGSGDRSERIRTYNFPQGRVTDHRINLTLYKIDDVMSGKSLDDIIQELISHDQAERLAELEY